LLQLSEKKQVDSLLNLYHGEMSEEEIKKALRHFNWNTAEAVKELNRIKKKASEKKTTTTITSAPQKRETPKEDFMAMSRQITTEVLEEIKNEVKKEKSPQLLIKEELENLLLENIRFNNNNAHPGLPGVYPSNPALKALKQKKERPVDEKEEEKEKENEEHKTTTQLKNSPVESSTVVTDVDNKPGEVVLNVKSLRANIGDKIIVTFKAQNHISTDWIGLYRAQADKRHKDYDTYQWVPAPGDGELQFQVPNKYGKFEFRYFRGRRGYLLKAVSPPFAVGPDVNLNVCRIPGKMEIAVKFQEKTGDKTFENVGWIGIYDKNESNNKSYIAYDWLANGREKGELTFPVPKNGDYEVRYFPQRRYYDTNKMPILVAENNVLLLKKDEAAKVTKVNYKVCSVDPETDYTWIGLFFVDEQDNTRWRRYSYVTEKEGELSFKTPLHAGVYQARLFANKSFVPILKSENIVVADTETTV